MASTASLIPAWPLPFPLPFKRTLTLSQGTSARRLSVPFYKVIKTQMSYGSVYAFLYSDIKHLFQGRNDSFLQAEAGLIKIRLTHLFLPKGENNGFLTSSPHSREYL